MRGKVTGPHEELTHRVIGVAMEVHRRIGPGHREEVYQRALESALAEAGAAFESQKNLPVYDEDVLLGYYIPDLIVEDKIIVEIKAFATLHAKYLGQVVTYLNHADLAVGLLINFGGRSLDFRRVFPSQYRGRAQFYPEWMFIPDWLREQKKEEPIDRNA